MARMWMIRSEGGIRYNDFQERGLAAIGWPQLAPHVKPGMSRKKLIELFQQAEPRFRHGTIVSGASQVWRFVNEISIGDWVTTYSPSNRLYLIGRVTGECEYHRELDDIGMSLARQVEWQQREIPRDTLSARAKNPLGSTLTLFEVPAPAMEELFAFLRGEDIPKDDLEIEEGFVDPWSDVEVQAVERIKDSVNELGWDDMQSLVAGILRAMGYKTQVSPAGSDRGKDIVASPDGFGFEHPRIVVEVKHRIQQTGSPDIRSFLGGRHRDDRGLFVSTGGFSKEAHYEADRATIPLALWTLDHLVRALVEHYDNTDTETKRLVPLKRIYWPA